MVSSMAFQSLSAQKRANPTSQKEIGAVEISRIRNKIDSALQKNNIPALSIGVVADGKLLWVEGFGCLNRESDVKVNGNTLYQIASDTKKITAIIVNSLVLEGKLSLDEQVTTYLKDILSKESMEKMAGITIRRLLRHKSGVPYREPTQKRTDGDPMLVEYTEQDIINDLNSMKLDSEPGTKFNYSNFGYAIVGYVCEKVSGKEYSALVKEYVADKYGMPNTGVYPDSTQVKSVASPYRKDNRNTKSVPWKMGKVTPAGGVYSSIQDLSNLMLAQMYVYQQLSENDKKVNPLFLNEIPDTAGGHYGFGLSKVVDEDGIRYGHGGDLDGYASTYVFMPKEDVGLIMLTSSGGKWFSALQQEIRIYLTQHRRN